MNEKLNYPGGVAVIGATAKVTKTDSDGDKNNYTSTFDLQISYKNDTSSELTWSLYELKSSSEASALKLEFAGEGKKCELVEEKQAAEETNVKYHYYYTQTGEANGGDCDFNVSSLGEAKATGTFTANTGTEELANATASTGSLSGFKVSTDEATTTYYFLVVKYANNDDQTVDAGHDIKFSLTVPENPETAVKAE